MKKLNYQFYTLFFALFSFWTVPIFGQVDYKVELLNDGITYRVSLTPQTTTSANATNTAQVTVLVPTGGFLVDLVNVTNLTGTWSATLNAIAPIQNPAYDYYSFGLTSIPTSAITYSAGVEVALFEFQNIGVCTGEVTLMESSDPDLPALNTGNQITVLGYGVGNSWSGNYDLGQADCREDTFISEPVHPGDVVEICPDISWILGGGLSLSLCDFGSLIGTTPGLGGGFSVDPSTGCVTYTANAGLIASGLDTLCMVVCNINSLCDTIDIIIPVALTDTIVLPPLDPGDTLEICTDLGWLTSALISVDDCQGMATGVTEETGSFYTLDPVNACIGIGATGTIGTSGIDTVCVSICDGNNICDTLTLIIPVTEPDTLVTTPLDPGEMVEVCIDLDWLGGQSFLTTDCVGGLLGSTPGLGGNYSLDPLSACLTYTASATPPTTGVDTACIIVCDLSLNCDTTYLLIPVLETTTLIAGPIDPGDTTAVCLNTDWLVGGVAGIANLNGSVIGVGTGLGGSYEIDPVTGCVSFIAATGLGVAGIDTLNVEVCDVLNSICDTTMILVSVTAGDTIISPTLEPGELINICIDTDWLINAPLSASDCDGGVAGLLSNLGGAYVIDPLTGCITYTAPILPSSVGSDTLCVEVCDNLGNCDTTIVIFPVTSLSVTVKAFLQGPFVEADGMMHDSLRVNGFIPLIEPYTALPTFTHVLGGLETTTNAVLSVTGNDAIVDWVFLELRSNLTPSLVVATRSCLIQRDGDIVDVDGVSPVSFLVIPGDYFIAVRHRLHLGVMTQSSVIVSSTPIVVDFTDSATPTNGTHAQTAASTGEQLMWGGDANADGIVILQGSGLGLPDHNAIFLEIFFAPFNLTDAPNYIYEAYSSGDCNMDGDAIYQGINNDLDLLIFFNVMLHPLNVSSIFSFVIEEQLP